MQPWAKFACASGSQIELVLDCLCFGLVWLSLLARVRLVSWQISLQLTRGLTSGPANEARVLLILASFFSSFFLAFRSVPSGFYLGEPIRIICSLAGSFYLPRIELCASKTNVLHQNSHPPGAVLIRLVVNLIKTQRGECRRLN